MDGPILLFIIMLGIAEIHIGQGIYLETIGVCCTQYLIVPISFLVVTFLMLSRLITQRLWWDLQETPFDVKPSITDGEFCGNQDEHVFIFSSVSNTLQVNWKSFFQPSKLIYGACRKLLKTFLSLLQEDPISLLSTLMMKYVFEKKPTDSKK